MKFLHLSIWNYTTHKIHYIVPEMQLHLNPKEKQINRFTAH